MRSSILRRNQQLLRNYKLSTRRTLTTCTPYSSPSPFTICQACSRKLLRLPTQNIPQRRFQSASSSSPATSAEPATNANPTPKTHYEFFPKTLPKGPPPNGPFHIDIRELRKEFLQLQAVAHPDRHPSHLKTRAEATSARINEAYKALQSPLIRAQYLLSLRGIDVAEDETAKVEDPELLMEVLDAREEIESAEEEADLEGMKRINEGRIENSEGVIERALMEDDLEWAKRECVRLRYWVNVKESLDAWEKGKPVVLVH